MSARTFILLSAVLIVTISVHAIDLEACDDGDPTLSLSGGASGDPHFTGFLGQRFEFQGYPSGVFRLFSAPEISVNARMVASDNNADGTFVGELGFVFGRSDEIFVGCGNGTLTVQMNAKPVMPDQTVIVRSASDDIALYFSTSKSSDMGSSNADVSISYGGLMATITKHKNRATTCFLNINLGVQPLLADLAVEEPKMVFGILGDTLRSETAEIDATNHGNKYWDGIAAAHGKQHEVVSHDLFDTPDVFGATDSLQKRGESRVLLSGAKSFAITSSLGRHLQGATIVCDENEACIGETCYCEPGFQPGNPHCEPCPDPCLQLVECDGMHIWINTCSGITGVTIRVRVIPNGGGGFTIQQIADIGGIGGGLTDEEFLRIMGSHHGFDWISPLSFDGYLSGGISNPLVPGAPEVTRGGGGMQFIRNYTIGGGGSGLLDIISYQPQNGGGGWPVDIEIELPGGAGGHPDNYLEVSHGGSGGSGTVLSPDGSGWYRYTVMPDLYWCSFNIRWGWSSAVVTTTSIPGGAGAGGSGSTSPSSPPPMPCSNLTAIYRCEMSPMIDCELYYGVNDNKPCFFNGATDSCGPDLSATADPPCLPTGPEWVECGMRTFYFDLCEEISFNETMCESAVSNVYHKPCVYDSKLQQCETVAGEVCIESLTGWPFNRLDCASARMGQISCDGLPQSTCDVSYSITDHVSCKYFTDANQCGMDGYNQCLV